MFEHALLFAFWRAVEATRHFADAEERPSASGQVPYVIGRIIASIENCVSGDKAELAQSTLRSLLDRLRLRNYFADVEFPINFLTYALEYAELKPAEPIGRYIVDRLDSGKSLED
jgi:hypothetical protein